MGSLNSVLGLLFKYRSLKSLVSELKLAPAPCNGLTPGRSMRWVDFLYEGKEAISPVIGLRHRGLGDLIVSIGTTIDFVELCYCLPNILRLSFGEWGCEL